MNNKDMVRAVLKQLVRQWEIDKRPFDVVESVHHSDAACILWDPSLYADHSHSGCNSKVKILKGKDENGSYIGCAISTLVDSKNGTTESVDIRWHTRFLWLKPTCRQFWKLFRNIENRDDLLREDEGRVRFVTRLNKLFPSAVDKFILGGKYDE